MLPVNTVNVTKAISTKKIRRLKINIEITLNAIFSFQIVNIRNRRLTYFDPSTYFPLNTATADRVFDERFIRFSFVPRPADSRDNYCPHRLRRNVFSAENQYTHTCAVSTTGKLNPMEWIPNEVWKLATHVYIIWARNACTHHTSHSVHGRRWRNPNYLKKAIWKFSTFWLFIWSKCA